MTQSEFLQDAIGMIDESLVETALMTNPKPRRRAVFFVVAACLTVMLLAIPVGILFANRTETPEVPIVDTTSVVSTQTALPPITTSPLPITSIGTTQSSPVLIIPDGSPVYYLPGALHGASSSADDYPGALAEGSKWYKKTDVSSRFFNFFGTNQEYFYVETLKTPIYPYEVDSFEAADVTVEINSQTGQIVGYENFNNTYKDNFKPIFDENATEADYLAYAKTILSKLVDVDLEEYQLEVKKYDYGEYHFRFSKAISGIRCRGYYTIGIEASGMISTIDIFINEEGFAPFEKLMIDMEKLNQIVMANYEMDTTSLKVLSHEEPEHDLYVEDGVLWAQSSIDFRYEGRADSEGNTHETVGSFCYMIKLAEVQK